MSGIRSFSVLKYTIVFMKDRYALDQSLIAYINFRGIMSHWFGKKDLPSPVWRGEGASSFATIPSTTPAPEPSPIVGSSVSSWAYVLGIGLPILILLLSVICAVGVYLRLLRG